MKRIGLACSQPDATMLFMLRAAIEVGMDHVVRTLLHQVAVGWLLLAGCPTTALAQVEGDPDTAGAERPVDSATHATGVEAAERASLSANPEIASAEQPPATRIFGDAGVVVLGGGISLRNLSYSSSQASQFSVLVEPGVDYFVNRAVSIGGHVLGSYSDGKGYDYFGPLIETKETGYGGGARLGINVAIGNLLSIWPKVGFGIHHYDTTRSVRSTPANFIGVGASQTEQSINAWWIDLYVPMLFHAASHYFVGMGPSIFADLNRTATFVGGPPQTNKRTGFALTLSTGGWL
jgi:hypothetical protein